MDEQARIKELLDYQILDTDPEAELDDLAEVASAICGTPMSLITFIDGNRQWYKSKIGVTVNEVEREHSFCRYTLDNPKEVLVVSNATKDERFTKNPFVIGHPFIRFYVGIPLESPNGNVLGTLCVMDTKPKKLSAVQKKAMKILAHKIMNYLNARKLIVQQKNDIEFGAQQLKKLTDQSPGVIYQLEMTPEGKMKFDFISKGISSLHPSLDPEQLKLNPELAFGVMHPDDVPLVKKSIQDSFINLSEWRCEYRVQTMEGQIEWHMGLATPEKKKDGSVVWYGTFQNITSRVEYESAMEQIAFDISHVLRRPVATLLGLTAIIGREELNEVKLKEYSMYINIVCEELDGFTKKLNETYDQKSKIIIGNNNVPHTKR